MEYLNSVTLDEEKCKGCTNCIKTCPTEAIRVRNGKATIMKELCIDCGECIRVCPHHAKKAVADELSALNAYKYTVALPAPSLYGQFTHEIPRINILKGLKKIGFDFVFEVSAGAEVVTRATNKLLLNENIPKPLISSACPAVVRLIQIKFPSLIDNLVPLESPMEVSAIMARKYYSKHYNIDKKDLGIFFISPCAAKITAVKNPIGIAKSEVDGIIPFNEVYGVLHEAIKEVDDIDDVHIYSGKKGIAWAGSGGEGYGLKEGKIMAVDGIQNVIKILEQVEDDMIKNVSFIEALSCPEGCLGGPLTVENRYVAKARLRLHMENQTEEIEKKPSQLKAVKHDRKIEAREVNKLDNDMLIAMQKLEKIELLTEKLPGLDCGACGAPNCKALAEDIVRGLAKETDCIFMLKEKLHLLATEMAELEAQILPNIGENNND